MQSLRRSSGLGITFEPYFLTVLLALPFIGSVICVFLLNNKSRDLPVAVGGAVTLMAILLTAGFYPLVSDGQAVRYSLEWVPQLGLNFSLRLDGFAWIFTMLIAVIGFLVVLYARYYMGKDDSVARFFSFLMAFMGAMLGIVLSGNVILLSVFWELTSIFSFMLISFWHHNAAAR
ncbi:NADH-Ubiquinone oxidoreductase (complex I) chain 5/L domain protein, partial [Rhizobium sp. PDO1-076]